MADTPTTDPLLPPSATAQERAISSALARTLQTRVPLRALWDPATCPPDLLPWLAWAWSVDGWDPDWSATVKRNAIQESLRIHRTKGTRGAILRALAAARFPDARLLEGGSTWTVGSGVLVGDTGLYVSGGASWAVYTVVLSRPINVARAEQLRRLLASVAPARCHLFLLGYEEAPWLIGDGSHVGDSGLTVY